MDNKLKYINGMWLCSVEYPQKFEFWMKGEQNGLDFIQIKVMNDFLKNFERYIKKAYDYAHQSVYFDDIKRNGDIKISSIHFESIDNFKIWFNFNHWDNGMLGILFKNRIPSDIYCDKR